MAEERLRRAEKEAMMYIMNTTSQLAYAKDDLKERLGMIPDGAERLQTILDGIGSLLDDMLHTIPVNQCVSLMNATSDYQVRVVPNAMPMTESIVITKANAKVLIDSAQEGKCISCVLDGKECRKCELEQVLEWVTPMTAYSDTLCPYNLAKWEE